MNLESVALATEGSGLSITEDNVVPTARCFQDTKKRQLVTRSSLQRMRCCACHLNHEEAMKEPCRVRQSSSKVIKNVQHYKVDVIAGNHNAAAYKNYKRQEYQDLSNSSVGVMLRQMQRETNMNSPFESRLVIGYSTNNHHLHGCSIMEKTHLD